MALKDRYRIRTLSRSGKALVQWQPAGQGHHTGERFGERKTRVQGQCPTLRKSSQHDSVRGDTGIHFAPDQIVHGPGRTFDAFLVLGVTDGDRLQIEPGVKPEPAVHRDRHGRGSWADHLHVARS